MEKKVVAKELLKMAKEMTAVDARSLQGVKKIVNDILNANVGWGNLTPALVNLPNMYPEIDTKMIHTVLELKKEHLQHQMDAVDSALVNFRTW